MRRQIPGGVPEYRTNCITPPRARTNGWEVPGSTSRDLLQESLPGGTRSDTPHIRNDVSRVLQPLHATDPCLFKRANLTHGIPKLIHGHEPIGGYDNAINRLGPAPRFQPRRLIGVNGSCPAAHAPTRAVSDSWQSRCTNERPGCIFHRSIR